MLVGELSAEPAGHAEQAEAEDGEEERGGPATAGQCRVVASEQETEDVGDDHGDVDERVRRGDPERGAAHLDADVVDGADDGRENRERDAQADAGEGEVVPEAVFGGRHAHHVSEEREEERPDGNRYQHRMDGMRPDGCLALHASPPETRAAMAVPWALQRPGGTRLARTNGKVLWNTRTDPSKQHPANLGPAPSGAAVPRPRQGWHPPCGRTGHVESCAPAARSRPASRAAATQAPAQGTPSPLAVRRADRSRCSSAPWR